MIRTLPLLLAGTLVGAAPSFAADLEAGKKKATEVCQACHGPDGNSPAPDFPRLGGQHRDYLEKALRDYKSGARKNPIMSGFATALSKADIENVSAFYASQAMAVTSKR